MATRIAAIKTSTAIDTPTAMPTVLSPLPPPLAVGTEFELELLIGTLPLEATGGGKLGMLTGSATGTAVGTLTGAAIGAEEGGVAGAATGGARGTGATGAVGADAGGIEANPTTVDVDDIAPYTVTIADAMLCWVLFPGETIFTISIVSLADSTVTIGGTAPAWPRVRAIAF
jgi:hypothetical protein